MQSARRGFSWILLIMLIAIVGIIGFAFFSVPAIDDGGSVASSSSSVRRSSSSSIQRSSSSASSAAVSSSATSSLQRSSSAASAGASASAVSGLNASQTTVAFYQWWATFRGSPFTNRDYRGNPYITASFQSSLDAHTDLTFDPVVCAAKDPPAFAVVASRPTGDTATVELRETYSDQTVNVLVGLRRENDMWKINAVQCPSGREQASEGEFCGGIAGIQCKAGLTCKYEGTFPDAGGECVK